jgi:nucleotide-binding universal stress UspA family protein
MPTLEAPPVVSFKNILLATDFSPASERALLYARAFAREHDSFVYTVHVSGPDEYQLLCPEAFTETFNQLEHDGTVGLGILRGLLRGLPSEVPLDGGQIWKTVKDVAVRNEIDLLMVGTHGRTGLQKVLLGSVAEEVFRDAPCPVLTVGAQARKPSDPFKISKVLLATDCCPGTVAPLYAAAICAKFGAALTALVVGEELSSNHHVTPQLIKEKLSAAAPELMSLDPAPIFLTEHGDPTERILKAAETMDAGLIVLGVHHPANVRTASHVPWGTASQVIAGSSCPVLTCAMKC